MTPGKPSERSLISVIVATYNVEDTIQKTINSINNQDFDDWELVVVDGGSSDRTVDILKSNVCSKIVFKSEKDRGIGDAWNKGLEMASGHWIIFLGSGDWFPNNTFSRIARKLTNPAARNTIFYGDVVFESPDGGHSIRYASRNSGDASARGFGFMHPSAFCHRSVFENIGLFNIEKKICVDTDFLLRVCCSKNYSFENSHHSVVMTTGGVSDRNWLGANLEYLECYVNVLKINPVLSILFKIDVYLRVIFF